MSLDTKVAYALIALPVLLLLFITGAGVFVVWTTLRDWYGDPAATIPGSMWQALLFVTVMDLILLAGLNVGQFFELWTDGWPGLVATVTAIFLPWLGLHAVAIKAASSKGGSLDIGNGTSTTAQPPTPPTGGAL